MNPNLLSANTMVTILASGVANFTTSDHISEVLVRNDKVSDVVLLLYN